MKIIIELDVEKIDREKLIDLNYEHTSPEDIAKLTDQEVVADYVESVVNGNADFDNVGVRITKIEQVNFIPTT
jgi:hypothetical protein